MIVDNLGRAAAAHAIAIVAVGRIVIVAAIGSVIRVVGAIIRPAITEADTHSDAEVRTTTVESAPSVVASADKMMVPVDVPVPEPKVHVPMERSMMMMTIPEDHAIAVVAAATGAGVLATYATTIHHSR